MLAAADLAEEEPEVSVSDLFHYAFLCHFCNMIVSALFVHKVYALSFIIICWVRWWRRWRRRKLRRCAPTFVYALKGPLAAAVAVEVAEAVLTNTPHKYLYRGELGCHFLVGMRVCMCGCVCV